tara:strand:+ start:3150 stop:3518 length:369 start_codon:yes stop_codon:yes gene_type:complete
MDGSKEIFKGKTFSGLLEDIYVNSKEKDRQIKILISDLQPLIKNSGDATIIVPLIKEYLEASVKNDEHLVKMAAIVQRAMARTENKNSDSPLLTEEEKKQLLEAVNDMTKGEKNEQIQNKHK